MKDQRAVTYMLIKNENEKTVEDFGILLIGVGCMHKRHRCMLKDPMGQLISQRCC